MHTARALVGNHLIRSVVSPNSVDYGSNEDKVHVRKRQVVKETNSRNKTNRTYRTNTATALAALAPDDAFRLAVGLVASYTNSCNIVKHASLTVLALR